MEEDVSEGELVELTGDDTFAAVCAGMEETRLLQAIENLPELYRDALYYRFVLQFSVPETAQTMGQSISATKKQIQRGKRKLLKLLEE